MTQFFGYQGSFLAHLDNKDYWKSHLSQWFYLTKITGKVAMGVACSLYLLLHQT